MFPQSLQNLIDLFSRLPGVGPKQAARMAFFVFREPDEYARAISGAILNSKKSLSTCTQCFRAMEKNGSPLCEICESSKRDQKIVCVVEKDMDIPNIEKTGIFEGTYHVLGGTIDLPADTPPERLHLKDLYLRVDKLTKEGTTEVVIATSPTTEGDTTALYIERILEPIQDKTQNLKMTRLGRGLSLGAEIEYTDEITLEHALKRRI